MMGRPLLEKWVISCASRAAFFGVSGRGWKELNISSNERTLNILIEGSNKDVYFDMLLQGP